MEYIIKNKKINEAKLLKYGFKKHSGKFAYKTDILDGLFHVTVEIMPPNIMKTQTVETETGELYTLHLTHSQGAFVGKIRDTYTKIIDDIKKNGFDMDVFRFEYSNNIIAYVKEKYGDEVEYLWEKFPNNAVARRKDNKKWYLAILTVKKDRLGLESSEEVEVIDLRANVNEVPQLIKERSIYPAYHMNKKHWITIILDGSVNIKKIYKSIDKSYELAKG